LDSRKQQRDKDADNRNDNQQFDQRKSASGGAWRTTWHGWDLSAGRREVCIFPDGQIKINYDFVLRRINDYLTWTMALPSRIRFKDVTLAQLRGFVEVCRLGGCAPAARKLLLTTPAVWEQMRALERHFGVQLLERRGGAMRPTSQGQRLLDMLPPLLAGIDSTKETLRQEDGVLPAQLTLVTNLRVLADEISRGMRTFQKTQPSVRLRVLYTGITDVERLLLAGEADFAFTLQQAPDSVLSSALRYEPVAEVDYLLVAPARHRVWRGRLQLRQIVQFPLVLGEPGAYSRHRVREVFHRFSIHEADSVAVETSSDEYTLACVRAGMGIGITIGTGRGSLYGGLKTHSLRRWFGTARLGFLWRGALVPPVQRTLANAIGAALRPERYS
jgi:DNA-binding transcriptional LysR family regulator